MRRRSQSSDQITQAGSCIITLTVSLPLLTDHFDEHLRRYDIDDYELTYFFDDVYCFEWNSLYCDWGNLVSDKDQKR